MMTLPLCVKCEKGVLLPLSDFGRDGAEIRFKAWVCSNPECTYQARIDNGRVQAGMDVQQPREKEERHAH